MDLIVRAVDVGSGNTKFVTAASGAEIRCVSFPSVAYLRISRHRGHPFHGIADSVSRPRRTPFHADRGQRFSVMADSGDARG